MAVRSRVHAQFLLVDATLALAILILKVALQVRFLLENLNLVRAECDSEPPRGGAILVFLAMLASPLSCAARGLVLRNAPFGSRTAAGVESGIAR
eukprot:CAMPEP_0183817544 /NCGR_PEP_ID=MMETSP0803_2-20130417/60532_1 /TAXON_ID=195967 /ORGANISM="Crustomastix stigmata, Strain CCMP3273" /LENGTH=94 /DNA_ID=CAMNT_0026062427 /DNA_START=206 /DNA_END=487 /DNA_ORIENTATION=-